jgi:hypothetical protein
MPVNINEISPFNPEPEPEAEPVDPDAPQEWKAEHWDEGGGIAKDNKGNSVIFNPDGTVATATPSGGSVTRSDGSGTEYNTDFEDPEKSFDRSF